MTSEAHFKLDYQFAKVHFVIYIDGEMTESEVTLNWVKKMVQEMLEAQKK